MLRFYKPKTRVQYLSKAPCEAMHSTELIRGRHEKSPNKKNPIDKSPNKKNPFEKSPNKKNPIKKSPNKKNPIEESPDEKNPIEKSPKLKKYGLEWS